jgi:hypothetical protein
MLRVGARQPVTDPLPIISSKAFIEDYRLLLLGR